MQVKLPVGKLGGFGSITALLFLFYGVVAIASAVMKIMQGELDGDEIRQLIVGGVFVFFGIVIFIKAKRAQRVRPLLCFAGQAHPVRLKTGIFTLTPTLSGRGKGSFTLTLDLSPQGRGRSEGVFA
jgi:hypothetical protein